RPRVHALARGQALTRPAGAEQDDRQAAGREDGEAAPQREHLRRRAPVERLVRALGYAGPTRQDRLDLQLERARVEVLVVEEVRVVLRVQALRVGLEREIVPRGHHDDWQIGMALAQRIEDAQAL